MSHALDIIRCGAEDKLIGAFTGAVSVDSRRMSLTLASPLFRQTRARRRVLLLMVVAIALAGFAQGAHYSKKELTTGTTDVHCLLCQYAGGTAALPALVHIAPLAPPPYRAVICPTTQHCAQRHDSSPYDARGPPLA